MLPSKEIIQNAHKMYKDMYDIDVPEGADITSFLVRAIAQYLDEQELRQAKSNLETIAEFDHEFIDDKELRTLEEVLAVIPDFEASTWDELDKQDFISDTKKAIKQLFNPR